ncbi:hypothetical protein D8674_031471 [Pyrus ussuriensis x Pyrus communis]|uniref:Uncharacterized protein n=1 Tax=Pyrus ussuriensis x Pyrus communis TaxID=2448454 RepID=A0A5N5F1I0_9ROSA|nr:hypothetical protein D8674_031471 [Pyrus ussuriensis x Pyrus communis]
MSSSSNKSDDGVSPLYRQGGSLSKVGYFKVAYFKISFDDSFRDFLKAYRHAIPSGVRVKCVKESSSCEPCGVGLESHQVSSLLLHVLCSMKCVIAQCFPNAVHGMVGFFNLSQFFDLDLTVNEFWYFFDIGYIEGVGQLHSRHRLFDHSSKGNHDWAKETLEINGEWEYDSSPELCEKCGLSPRDEVKQIKAKVLVHPIVVVKPAANEGGKKRYSSSAQEMRLRKSQRLILLRARAARSVLVTFAIPKVASSIADKIAQHRNSVVPSMPKFVPKCLSEAKFGSALERLVIMKSNKVPSPTKVAPKLIPLTAETDSSAESKETARVGSYQLKDMDVCAKFVDGVKGVVCPSSFAKHTIEYKKTALLLHSATYAKEENLIVAYKQVIHFKKVVDKINEILNKEVKELQRSQADFYKLGYVDHLFRRPSNFEFVEKDFEASLFLQKTCLTFTFEASIGEVVGEVDAQAGAARGATSDDAAVKNVATAEVIGSLLETVGYLSAFGSNFRVPGQLSIRRTGLIEAVENHLVGCFGLPIALRIPWRGHALLDAIFLEKLHQIFAYELQVILCDDGLKDTKSANDVPQYEALYVRLSCAGGIGPSKSIPYCINGQGLVCGCSSLAGSFGTGL